jgi:cysteinyl-tRNA synthetase
MHNNMITINGQKMGKSLGNFITLKQLFTGEHALLQQAFSPMTIRFFILQAHYRSTLDFSNEGLQAAEKGMNRLMSAVDLLDGLTPGNSSTSDVRQLRQRAYETLNDDLNTAIAISQLFEGARIINSVNGGTESLTAEDIAHLKETMQLFVFDILGLKSETKGNDDDLKGVMELLLALRAEAKAKKDFATSDKIRDELNRLKFVIKDGKEGTTWSKN